MMRPMIVALAAALLLLLLLPADVTGQDDEATRCPRGELTNADRLELTRPWVEGLTSFYATGDTAELEALSTPSGLEGLAAFDWRYGAVRDGGVRFEESAEIVEFNDWHEWCVDRKRRVRLDIEPIIDIAPGARTRLAANGHVVEAVDRGQRRAYNLTFVRDPETQAWLVDDVAEGLHRPRYIEPRTARPCPGLRDPARAADRFLMEPWCTADGDGRKIFEWRGKPGGELATGRASCWPGTHSIMLGLPPGTPIGFGNVREYVRDPRGTSPEAERYRRDFRPPSDAISTGITNGYATIWTSKKLGDQWLIIQIGDRFERWPSTVAACPAN